MHAQYVGVAAGGVFSQRPSNSDNVGGSFLVAADAGLPLLPFLSAGMHYSFAKPDLTPQISIPVLGAVRLTAHTLTFDARLHTPEFGGWRAFGLAGAGMTRFNAGASALPTLSVSTTEGVFTFGGGFEKRFAPLWRAKFEVRDYVTSSFFSSDPWHRVAVTFGVVFGR
jgi:hypothetical protein